MDNHTELTRKLHILNTNTFPTSFPPAYPELKHRSLLSITTHYSIIHN